MNNASLKINKPKITSILMHVIFWLFVLAIPLMMSQYGSERPLDFRHYAIHLVRTSVFIIIFYVNYLYLIPKFFFHRKFAYYILCNVLLVIAMMAYQTFMIDLFVPPRIMMREINNFSGGRNKDGFPMDMHIWGDFMFIILVIGMSVALKVTARWYKDSMDLKTIQTTQLEANLKYLRSQLNPHFLFNTLNNIYSLIAIDKNRAQESVHRLSDLLRYILYENDQKFVPVNKELEFTLNYIDLMKLRLSPNVKLDVNINDSGSEEPIASLLFMTLIENAFKHGIKNDGTGFIDISILVEKNKGILCTIENSLNDSPNMESRNSGIGLSNLSERLDLLYPDKHEFVAEKRENSFYAMLRIDFDNTKTE